MGNVIGSLFSGFTHVIGELFGSPRDFLAGKSCSSVCGSTWDFICYIEHFCIANLLKLAMISSLLYCVLLFFYLLFKLGICKCVGRTICKMLWGCCATCLSMCEYGCTSMCYSVRMLRHKHQKHGRLIKEYDTSISEVAGGSFSSYHGHHMARHMREYRRRSASRPWRSFRGHQLRKSLRPRISHRVQIQMSGDSVYANKRYPIKHAGQGGTVDDIRVTRTSKFAHKGGNNRGRISRRRN